MIHEIQTINVSLNICRAQIPGSGLTLKKNSHYFISEFSILFNADVNLIVCGITF